MRSFLFSAVFSAFLLVSAPLSAAPSPGSRADVLRQAEHSMRVTGTLHIETDGRVSDVLVDKPDQVPEGVLRFVRQSAAAWQFEPVQIDGQTHAVKSPMSIRLVARQLDDGGYELAIRSVHFGDNGNTSGLEKKKMKPPQYPEKAWRAGAFGTVFLLLKINREGTVEDVVAEQVNLGFADRERVMQDFRQLFAQNAVAAARKWTYVTPSEGEQAQQPYWVVRVPIEYSLRTQTDDQRDDYGKWRAYVPGPRQTPQWREVTDAPGFSPDALGNGIFLAGTNTGPKLLTPLDGN